MFGDGSSDSDGEGEKVISEEDDREEEGLGYFQPVDSEESESEEIGCVRLPDSEAKPTWDKERNKWLFAPSSLCSYIW